MSSTAKVPRHVHDGVGGTKPRRESVDLARLPRLLSATVGGEVRFDAAGRTMYVSDASDFRQVPLGVVVPKTVNRAIVIDSSKYLHAIGDADRERGTVRGSAPPITSASSSSTSTGLDVQEATGGCCGLAGSWGFEQGKYDI